MLTNKPFSAGDIVTLKLTTGDELIARFINEVPNSITISRPLVLQLAVDEMGRPELHMVPSFLFTVAADAHMTLDRQHVVVMVRSDDAAQKNYTTVTTGLAVPQNSGIITTGAGALRGV
jgi:hypothetical protein